MFLPFAQMIDQTRRIKALRDKVAQQKIKNKERETLCDGVVKNDFHAVNGLEGQSEAILRLGIRLYLYYITVI